MNAMNLLCLELVRMKLEMVYGKYILIGWVDSII